jgi:hypothetical protein
LTNGEAGPMVDLYFDRAPKVWTDKERAMALLLHVSECKKHLGSEGCRVRHLTDARDYFNGRQ